MVRQEGEKQQKIDLVIMEQLVPENHFLRKVDRVVDFSFIYDLCAPLYCADNGRPAIDPEILFRMLLVGYLYGIKSEKRLEEEINYNIAYKWFCGLELTEKAPDATTISQNRRRRFRDNNIAEQIHFEVDKHSPAVLLHQTFFVSHLQTEESANSLPSAEHFPRPRKASFLHILYFRGSILYVETIENAVEGAPVYVYHAEDADAGEYSYICLTIPSVATNEGGVIANFNIRWTAEDYASLFAEDYQGPTGVLVWAETSIEDMDHTLRLICGAMGAEQE